MASYVTPKKNTQFIFYIGLVSQTDTKTLLASPTVAAGDFKLLIDGVASTLGAGSTDQLATTPTVVTGKSTVKITLSAAEMNGDNITVVCKDASGAEWCDALINIQTSTNQIDDLATVANQTTILNRLGSWTGSGINTILGGIRALAAKAAALTPSDISSGTTFDNTTDSLEAVRDKETDIETDTQDIQSRLPAALVSGRMDSNVQAMANNVVTAAAIAADAIDADALAADAVSEIQSGLATSAALVTAQADLDDIQTRLPAALVSGRMDSSVGAMQTGVVTAAAIATDAIDADALATDAVTEIQSGLATSTAVADIQADVNDIQNRIPAALVGGRMDSDVGNMQTDVVDADALAADAAQEVADATWATTLTTPGQGAPPANPTAEEAVTYPYKGWRNKKTAGSGVGKLYADDGTTVDQKWNISDNGTTTTSDEVGTGP